MMEIIYDHENLQNRLYKINRIINVHRNHVFEMYTFKDPGIRSTTSFLSSVTQLDKLLIQIQKDFRRISQSSHLIEINEIAFVFRCIDEIDKILEKNISRFKTVHNKYYREENIFHLAFFINKAVNKLYNELTSDSIILGSRMRSCLLLLNKQP